MSVSLHKFFSKFFSIFGFGKKQEPSVSKGDKIPDYTVIGSGVRIDNPQKIVPITVPNEDRKRGMFVFGTTGVGKTRLCENLIEQDVAAGRSIVYIDPKGDQEIFTKIYESARRHGRLDELQLITPIYPEHSAVIDPMAYYYMPDELVGHIISGIPTGKEPFFRDVAKELAMCIVQGNLILGREKGVLPCLNFDTIRQGIRRPALQEKADALRRLSSPEALQVAGMIDDILELTPENYSKVSSTLRNRMTEMSAGNIGKIIGQADSNRFIKRLEEGKRVILVVHTGSMITREAGSTLAKVILSMILSFIGRVNQSDKKCIDPPLSIIIDEAQLALFNGAEILFSMGGSAGVYTTALCQSINLLNTCIDEAFTKSILDNTNTKIFMRCSDAETSEYVVKHFGVHTKLSGIYGANQVTTRETEEDILKVQDILSLQRREFYMMSYNGRWKGITSDARQVDLKIRFPSAPAAHNFATPDIDMDLEAGAANA